MSEQRIALLLVLPTLVILIALAVYPLGWAGVLAFRVENLFNPRIGRWVGLRNFEKQFFGSEQFHFLGTFSTISVLGWSEATGLVLHRWNDTAHVDALGG